ncbi:chaplin [Streptomyces spongiae]|uniref:Chaplin n=1 Tax=Streptomyces spongiae TaxID=565072 RepID=A0A5N8Y032_9ACTN|nr:chaplin [Streptomyces spongiae]MPY64969.1 chaplin [Streptomyces spongiae]
MSRIAKVGAVALGTGAVVLSGAGLATADADAKAAAIGSPGVLSGNVVQVPVHIPVNVCGNTVTGLGGLDRASGNVCKNGDDKNKKDDKKDGKKAHQRHGH